MPKPKQKAHTQVDVAVKTRILFEEPPKYNVIFWNDDVTTMEFVVEVLMTIFSYNEKQAVAKMLTVHRQDKANVGTYVKSIAEAKKNETLQRAKEQNFPLKVTIEEAN